MSRTSSTSTSHPAGPGHPVTDQTYGTARPEPVIKQFKPKVGNNITSWRLPNGLLHRVSGPAIVWDDGSTAWYQRGQLHRVDGPAVESTSGESHWYLHGKCHRVNGPAVTGPGVVKPWWLWGFEATEVEVSQVQLFDSETLAIAAGLALGWTDTLACLLDTAVRLSTQSFLYR